MARPITTTAGQLAVNESLPEQLRNHALHLDKAGLGKLMARLASEYPEQYRDVSFKLNRMGNSAAYFSGGNSFSLASLTRSPASLDRKEKIEKELDKILADESYDDESRSKAILTAVDKHRIPQMEEIYKDALAAKNPLAMQILSGARGNKQNLNSLIGSDLFYTDHRDTVIPVPVVNSYGEGLSAAEFYAGAFGARKGVVDGKLSTMNSGYLSKLGSQAAHRLVVTDEDDDTDREEYSALRGLPVDVSDMDSVGSLLARPVAGYKRNTVLTAAILGKLKEKGLEEILVRSPTVGGSRDGGVFARDVGHREYGVLPGRGEFVGLVAAQAAGEPLAQGGLCLAAGTKVRMSNGKIKLIEQIKVGDWVIGCDKSGRLRYVRVLNKYDNGVKPCVTTKFKYDQNIPTEIELTSTLDHKVLAFLNADTDSKLHPVGEFGPHFTATLPLRGLIGHDSESLGADGNPTYLIGRHAAPKRIAAIRTSQIPAGDLQTWDIEVDHPDHIFLLANGLAVSNSSKHSGGVAGAGTTASGFDYIQSLIQIPKTFQGMATHAQRDGFVSGISPAPAGGFFVTVDGEQHHVRADNNLTVKKGDQLEAGDLLSDGIPHPAEFVKHKGIGEGRKQFVKAIRDAYKSGGFNLHRRNAELLGRGLIDHVRIDSELEGFNQDDIVPYSRLERDWQPRAGSLATTAGNAKGMYLERPVLHYSLGTHIKPSVIAKLKQHGITDVLAHSEPPPFSPEMIRAQDNLQHDPDWMTRMYGSGLKGSLLDAAHHGSVSDPDGTSFVPSLARSVDFGSYKYVTPSTRPLPKDKEPELVEFGSQAGHTPISTPAGSASTSSSLLPSYAKTAEFLEKQAVGANVRRMMQIGKAKGMPVTAPAARQAAMYQGGAPVAQPAPQMQGLAAQAKSLNSGPAAGHVNVHQLSPWQQRRLTRDFGESTASGFYANSIPRVAGPAPALPSRWQQAKAVFKPQGTGLYQKPVIPDSVDDWFNHGMPKPEPEVLPFAARASAFFKQQPATDYRNQMSQYTAENLKRKSIVENAQISRKQQWRRYAAENQADAPVPAADTSVIARRPQMQHQGRVPDFYDGPEPTSLYKGLPTHKGSLAPNVRSHDGAELAGQPAWYSGHPEISAEYAMKGSNGAVLQRSLDTVKRDGPVGPFSRHIMTDSREMDDISSVPVFNSTARRAGTTAEAESPYYERVGTWPASPRDLLKGSKVWRPHPTIPNQMYQAADFSKFSSAEGLDSSATYGGTDSFGQDGYKTNALSSFKMPKMQTGGFGAGGNSLMNTASKAIGQVGDAAAQVGDLAGGGSWLQNPLVQMGLWTAGPAAATKAWGAGAKALGFGPKTVPPGAPPATGGRPMPRGMNKPAIKPGGGGTATARNAMNKATSLADDAARAAPKVAPTAAKAVGLGSRVARVAGPAALAAEAGYGAYRILGDQQGLMADDAADMVSMNRGGTSTADMAGQNITRFDTNTRMVNALGGTAISSGKNLINAVNPNSTVNQQDRTVASRNSAEAAATRAAMQTGSASRAQLANAQTRLRDEQKALQSQKTWRPWLWGN